LKNSSTLNLFKGQKLRPATRPIRQLVDLTVNGVNLMLDGGFSWSILAADKTAMQFQTGYLPVNVEPAHFGKRKDTRDTTNDVPAPRPF
jgi:hypothetical protein